MSYDIDLKDPVTGAVLQGQAPHQMAGGTYALGGTTDLSLNITYNYAKHFYRVFGEQGIRTLYGLSAALSIPLLEQAITQLADDASEDYWAATEGNAKRALHGLLALARLRPDGVWDGD